MFPDSLRRLIAGLVFAGAAGLVQAQDASSAGAGIDERFRSTAPEFALPAAPGEAILTGEGDLVLLRRARRSSVHGSLDAAYTDNAFLADSATERDSYAVFDLGVSTSAALGTRALAYASLGTTLARYVDFDQLDYSAATLNLGLQALRLGLDWRLNYQFAEVYDASFGDRQLTQHRPSLQVGRAMRGKRLELGAYVNLERVSANPREYDNWAAGLQLAASGALPRPRNATAYAMVQYQRREYDGFFPGLVGTDRSDDRVGATLGVSWRSRNGLQLNAGYSWQRNHSTSDVNRYTSGSGSLGIGTRWRF